MTSSPNPAISVRTPWREEPKWSHTEKSIARKAFDQALHQELDSVIVETKVRAAKIQEPSELWDLERYLYKRRREIDEKYDYRYSVLLLVFTRLIAEGLLREEDLRGLGEDKLSHIRRALSLR